MILTPIEKAELIYQREPCENTFPQDLALLRVYGHVISSPRLFVMGRPIQKDATRGQIYDLSYTFSVPDTWLCHVAAVSGACLIDLLDAMPYYLPYIAWEKRNKLRVYKTSLLRKHFQNELASRRTTISKLFPI
jgi:hypothetical protein